MSDTAKRAGVILIFAAVLSFGIALIPVIGIYAYILNQYNVVFLWTVGWSIVACICFLTSFFLHPSLITGQSAPEEESP
jgi:hypothetical protein